MKTKCWVHLIENYRTRRNDETKKRRDEETKKRRNEEAKKRRNGGMKKQRNAEMQKWRNEETKTRIMKECGNEESSELNLIPIIYNRIIH